MLVLDAELVRRFVHRDALMKEKRTVSDQITAYIVEIAMNIVLLKQSSSCNKTDIFGGVNLNNYIMAN
jgi:predicted transcriptional regulator